MRFTALGDGVAEFGEILYYAFCFGCDEGVVWIGTTYDRRKARVNIVPGGRTHWRGLEAAGKAHALAGEFVDVGSVGLPPVAPEVAEGTIVGDNKDDVGLARGRDGEEEQEEEAHFGFGFG